MKFYATILVLLSFQSQIISQQITFTDVAVSMGINHPIQFIRGSISFCDFNGDGKDDLSFSSIQGEPMYLYKNNSDLFTDVTSEMGLTDSFRTMNLLWSDYDNDGDKDLFAAVDDENTYSRLYRNDGASGFTDVTIESGIGTGISVLTIDSCEYVWVKRGYSGGLSHKGNCKFCAERSSK